MCGRYSIVSNFEAVRRLFGLTNAPNWWTPRSNVAPTQEAPVVRLGDGGRELVQLRWGLVPYWAKDPKIGYSTINAQAETAATKPAFRDAFTRRRCLVVTDGFYEWKKLEGGAKQPYRIVMRDRAPFALAGLWERWKANKDADPIESFTVITTSPNEICAPIHDRMPAIIAPAGFDDWLSIAAESQALLRPHPAESMEAYPVSKAVGNVQNEGLELVEPIAAQPAASTLI
jgi:putative SOS response-associated peptidase YedK